MIVHILVFGPIQTCKENELDSCSLVAIIDKKEKENPYGHFSKHAFLSHQLSLSSLVFDAMEKKKSGLKANELQ